MRQDARSPTPGVSSAIAVWLALVAALLNAVGDVGPGRRSGSPPEVTRIRLPPGARSDLSLPGFSRPTAITNPLFPVSHLIQVIQLGAERGERQRFEMTRLPGSRTVAWDGRQVATVASQLVAYSDGRVAEVATDLYAQADDGSVWHFGEDVANYDDGVLVDREGSWLAGRDGPPGLVMPAAPKVGDVFRSVNGPGQAAEEVTVRSVGQAVDGPRSRVEGAVVIQEILDDGSSEDKTFAPGYGELSARLPAQDELYRVALAAPTDVVPGAVPEELATIAARAGSVLDGLGHGWADVAASVDAMTAAWKRYATTLGAGMLEAQMSDRLADLVAAAAGRRSARVPRAALDVAEASLDLQLRHRPPADVDRDRLGLLAGRLSVDAMAGDPDAVDSALVALEATRARIDVPPGPARATLDAALADLGVAVRSKDLAATVARSLPVR